MMTLDIEKEKSGKDIITAITIGLILGVCLGILGSFISIYSNRYFEQEMYKLMLDTVVFNINLSSGFTVFVFMMAVIIKIYFKKDFLQRSAVTFIILNLIFFLILHYIKSAEFPDFIGNSSNLAYMLMVPILSLITLLIILLIPRLIEYLENKNIPSIRFSRVRCIVVAATSIILINSFYYFIHYKQREQWPNIIFINIDTLRADHLSAYGYFRETSPNIDSFSTQGVLFENTVVEAPFTMVSVASLFTSQYPYTHGVRDHPDVRNHTLNKQSLTLAEVLNNAGYVTAGITANSLISPQKGYDQGFNVYKYADIASDVNNKSIKWLNKNFQKKFFLYIHYIDPHLAYAPPNEHIQTFDKDYEGEFKYSFQRPIKDKIFVSDLSERDFNHAIALYDEEIKYTDSQIGILLVKIKELGIFDNSIIIITADHGESLGEHGVYFAHDFYLYDPMVRVPLIIKFPNNQYKNKKINDVVRVIDIMPSILDIAHISSANIYQGVSLVPTISEGKKMNFYAYAESCSYRPNYGFTIPMEQQRFYLPGIKGKTRMVRNGKWKLIYIPGRTGRLFELYNIEEDPHELNNILDNHPETFQQLKQNLFEFLEKDTLEYEDYINPKKIDRGTLDVLKSLGYIK